MDIKEITNHLSSSLRGTKEKLVAEDPEHCQPMMCVYFFRDESIMAMMMCTDRDKALETVWLGSSGFSVDAVGLSSECWSPGVDINPETGKMWEHGEPGAYVAKHGITEVVGESLICTVVNRAGEVAYSEQKFRQNGPKVEWLIDPDINLDSEEFSDGYIPQMIREAMARPTLIEHMKSQGADPDQLGAMLGLSGERQRFHMDMAVIRQIVDRELIVAMMLEAPQGSERQQLIEERMEVGLFPPDDIFGDSDSTS